MEMFLGGPNETKMVNAGHVMHDLPKSFLYTLFPEIIGTQSEIILEHNSKSN